jgi:hypothetical protein
MISPAEKTPSKEKDMHAIIAPAIVVLGLVILGFLGANLLKNQ